MGERALSLVLQNVLENCKIMIVSLSINSEFMAMEFNLRISENRFEDRELVDPFRTAHRFTFLLIFDH